MQNLKGEYFISAEVEDVLAQFVKDMQVIQTFDNGKTRVLFKAKRLGNRIEVKGRMYDSISHSGAKSGSKDGETADDVEGFSYEVSKIKDGRSSVVGSCINEFPFIQMLYCKYLARMGTAFDAKWGASVEDRLQEIEAEIENEKGGHWELTDWTSNPETGMTLRYLAFIPDSPNSMEPGGMEVGAAPTAVAETESATLRDGHGELTGELPEAWWAKVQNSEDRIIIENLRQGLSAKTAALALDRQIKTITNRESVLRKILGPEVLPLRRDLRGRKLRP